MGGWLQRRAGLVVVLVTLLLGLLLFVWRLGSTGLVDETPPLFAASARAMAETGDWLVPQVNGLPRYDKPPLVYWLMALVHRLPGQERWDPLGSWAAGLPSALATVGLMLLLADTVRRWPQAAGGRGGVLPTGLPTLVPPLVAALAFALSPLVLLWGRIGVSDALFTATLATSLVLCWRSYADPRCRWWFPWPVLALAVLTKGPVALVLVALTLLLFGLLQADGSTLRHRLRPLTGLALASLLSLPWYGLTLLREGRPFWDSFFGYHNLQRFTAVVNHHLQPWWFFGPILVVASLPVTPLLLLGLARALGPHPLRPQPVAPGASLNRFAACWLVAVLAFFTIAATKLPSYWLPATPAAGLLILLAGDDGIAAPGPEVGAQRAERPEPAGLGPGGSARAGKEPGADRLGGREREGLTLRGLGSGSEAPGGSSPCRARDRALERAWSGSLALCVALGLAYLAGPLWVPLIQDPELPTLPAGILASGRLPLAGGCYLLAATLGWWCRRRVWPLPLLLLQLPLVAFVPLALLPLWNLGDQLRGAPVRAMAEAVRRQARPNEPLAMVGILKPSLHYYSRRVVLYEGLAPEGPINLADRLGREHRAGQLPSSAAQQPTVLLVIDHTTAALPHWQELGAIELARSGLYHLWRVDRRRLEARAVELARGGGNATWWQPRPERY
jgi:4-amino-4-deoxy-L-arabinose transferase-like glycosyltransferase